MQNKLIIYNTQKQLNKKNYFIIIFFRYWSGPDPFVFISFELSHGNNCFPTNNCSSRHYESIIILDGTYEYYKRYERYKEYPAKEPSGAPGVNKFHHEGANFFTFFIKLYLFMLFNDKYCFYCLLNMLISIKITFNRILVLFSLWQFMRLW